MDPNCPNSEPTSSVPPGPVRNPQSGPLRCMLPDESETSGNPGASNASWYTASPPSKKFPLVGVLRTSTCATPCADILLLLTSVKAVSDDSKRYVISVCFDKVRTLSITGVLGMTYVVPQLTSGGCSPGQSKRIVSTSPL